MMLPEIVKRTVTYLSTVAYLDDDAGFSHLYRVAIRGTDQIEVLVAYLHDAIEDGKTDEATLRPLLGDYADEVLAAVKFLTRRYGGQSYEAYISEMIESGNQTAMRVKCLDLLDHLSPERAEWFADKPGKLSRYLHALERLLTVLSQTSNAQREEEPCESTSLAQE